MNSTRATKLLLYTGITVFLLGTLMSISHMKNGTGLLLGGVVLLGLGFLPQLLKNNANSTYNNQDRYYPTLLQSVGITGILILGMLAAFPVNVWCKTMMSKEASLLIYYLFATGIPLGIVLLIRRRKTNHASMILTFGNTRIIPYLVLGSIALFIGVASPIVSAIPMSENFKKALLELGGLSGIYGFLLAIIAAPIFEEFIFRGIILEGLLKNYSPVKAILVSSILFGVAHLNPWQFVSALLIGLFSGWVYYHTRSLIPSVIIHASYNLTGFLAKFVFNVDASMDNSVVRMYGGLTNFLLAVLGSIAVVLICLYSLRGEFIKMKQLTITDPDQNNPFPKE